MECIIEFLINMAFLYRLLNISTSLKMSNFLHDGNLGICLIPIYIPKEILEKHGILKISYIA